MTLNKRKSGYSKGFTFIELIVVMAVVVIMTMVALGYFGNADRLARLNYSTDSLISAIIEQLQLSKSGNAVVQSKSNLLGRGLQSQPTLLCYALKIVKGKGSDNLGSVDVGTSDYNGQTDKCDQVGKNAWQPREVTGQTVILQNLEFKKQSDSENTAYSQMELYFKPPFGYIYKLYSGKFTPLRSGILTVVLSSMEVSGISSTVKMNMATGRVYKDVSNVVK